ncbi:MAG: SCP2 sterol-binding domain-containing protein [Proteobacteria bacterium]|nr:SCP2 sterol-binding domain-containing protein [Pseudomonadota bacterium]
MAAPSPLGTLAALANRTLGASTPARALLAELEGRSFAIELAAAPGQPLVRLRLAADNGRLAVNRDDLPADATVRGTPLGLAALLAGRDDGRLTAAGVSIAGDAEVAAAFEKLLRLARPDAEEELARVVGEIPAHYAARAARTAADWGRRAFASLTRNVGEYLVEEGRDVVSRPELDGFHAAVDQLREDFDRVEARLALAAARCARAAGPT